MKIIKEEKLGLKILITGNLGFVGSETQRLLEKEGHEVIGYDIMNRLDILDYYQLEHAVLTGKPDRILHLAAIARFAEADKEPKRAFETNVLGTGHVAKVAQKWHIPVVYASTGSVYMPIKQEPPITEEFKACGNSVYGCTKFFGEEYIKLCNPHIILRYSHLLGAEKRFHGLIGGFLDRIERGLAPTLYGGSQSNDFCYVKDIARANMIALTIPWDRWNEVYNIGTGEELTAKEAGEMVCEVFNYKGEIDIQKGREVDPSRFVYDMTKTNSKLGFYPKYKFKDALIDMAKELGYNISNGKAIKKTISEQKIQGKE